MDVLDSVRELKPAYPVTTHAPRRALHREIARSQRRPLRRVALVTAGAAAAAAVAITASTFAPPGSIGGPEAASASAYLNETAASLRSSAVAGHATSTTIVLEQLRMVGGPDASDEPFGSIRTGATGAVLTESSDSYVSSSDGSSVTWTSSTDFHAGEVYGDAAAVEAAWNSYYGETYVGVLDKEPVTSAPNRPIDVAGAGIPVPLADFPADPQAFLNAWTQGMTEASMEAGTASGADDAASAGQSAAENMMWTLATSVLPYVATPEYRATFLEALALAEGIVVEDGDASAKVLVHETSDQRFRLVISPEDGMIVSAELSAPDGGTAEFVPEGTPDYAIRTSTAPALD